ncbi:MAG: hypothetical protein NQU42_06940 [Methanothrix sp.]|uniref:hypothetical protein n=1 Tax=Methanothrix sp. TaxID=90426 RepID=UPI0025D041DE|nr:hypothetical protein [Methanothrix sp.]MCQ8903808.1 hypothetical protein [Methanothrix sp.]
MELERLIRDFLVRSRRDLRAQLEAKYGLDPDEIDEMLDRMIHRVYGPALSLAESLKHGRVALFVEREGCSVCRDTTPELERFLKDHPDFSCIKLEYSKPEGLIYHILHQEESGRLPLVALISDGTVMMLETGSARAFAEYERAAKCEGVCEVRAPGKSDCHGV